MAEIRLPLSITYETQGTTPVSDIIEALKAADTIARDTFSIMPSLIDGLIIEESSLNVRSLTQESPLREVFLIALIVTYQDDLGREVRPMLEEMFNLSISDQYNTLVTVAFMAVTFYGVGIAIDAVKKTFVDSLPRAKFEELIQVLAVETGKSASDIRNIIQAKFGKPSAAKRIASAAKRIFLPSQKDQNAPVVFDRDRIPSETVREVPFPSEADKSTDFDRYTPMSDTILEIHAMDRDKSATGWAAVAEGVSDKRLKARVMDPVLPADLWGRERIRADIVLVSKLTSDGYVPAEIQITAISPVSEPPATE